MSNANIAPLLTRLRTQYPNARYELNWTTPVELLVATILAAQCTDERVNRVTESLFRKYRSAADFAQAPLAELEEAVRPTGFYRNKAKSVQGACRTLVQRFGGEVPRTMDEMLTLPGVERKTANVVLNTAFNLPSGIIVDTHVARVSQRMGLSEQEKPPRIEEDLMRLVPQKDWTFFGPAMVLHGRYTCTARAPKCPQCDFRDMCPKKLGATAEAAAEDEPESAPAPKVKAVSSRRGASKEAPADAPSVPSGNSRPSSGNGSDSGRLADRIPASWRPILQDEIQKPYFHELEQFVSEERQKHTVFPPQDEVFSALELTPYDKVSVFLLGQDPYHDDNQAHGLCFSVRPGVRPPPSLVNMYAELQNDVGFRIPNHGYLVPWAKQGILMLNAVLTVQAHSPNSHKNHGWETFTDAVIRKVNEKRDPVVFVLWGAYAQKKAKLIDTSKHVIIQSAHPSPLSARNGFFGSRPFSAINQALKKAGKPEIHWQLENL